MASARGSLGNPGISIMLPEIATTKPAPAESDASVIFNVHPVGAPISLGLSESEYCVLAMHTGRPRKAPFGKALELRASMIAEVNAHRAVDLGCDLADLFFERVF